VYLLPTDSYNGQTSFSLCFKEGVHPEQIDKARVKDFGAKNKLKYYNHGIHLSSFCLPNYIKDMLIEWLWTDATLIDLLRCLSATPNPFGGHSVIGWPPDCLRHA